MTASWSEVPAIDDATRPRPFATTLLIGLWLAALGPVVHAWSRLAGHPALVAGVAAVATVVLLVLPSRWWLVRLLTAGAAAGVVLASEGDIVALWLGAGLVLASWVCTEEPPVPLLKPPGPGTVPPALALTAVAAFVGFGQGRTWQPLVPMALACTMPVLTRFGHGALDRVALRVGQAVGDLVRAVLFGLLGLFAVLLPWAAHRILRFDPLDPRPGWTVRERRPLRAAQPWTTDASPSTGTLTRRLRVPLAIGAVGLLAMGAVWGYRRAGVRIGGDRSGKEYLGVVADPGEVPPAQRGAAWYPAYRDDIAWALDERVALRPFELYRLWDFETSTVSVHDGDRDTWKAPACDCRRVTLWLYGGSAAFGFEQRDEHTIASELARLAHDDGITLDVVNRGLPGQLLWRQATRFAWDTVFEDPPDLAVFYGGAEEVDGAFALNDPPVGDVSVAYEPLAEDLYDEIQSRPGDPRPAAPGTAFHGLGSVEELTPDEVGELAVTRYDRSRQMTDDTADATDVEVRYVWQPTRFTRPSEKGAAEAAADRSEDVRTGEDPAATYAAASDALPDDVLDLTTALDDVSGQLFVDDTHHNEAGARIIAQELYRSLRSDLRALADGPGAGS